MSMLVWRACAGVAEADPDMDLEVCYPNLFCSAFGSVDHFGLLNGSCEGMGRCCQDLRSGKCLDGGQHLPAAG